MNPGVDCRSMRAVWAGLTSGMRRGTAGSIRWLRAFEITGTPASAKACSTSPATDASRPENTKSHVERSGLGRDDFHRRNALGHLGPADPVCGLAIRPTGGALRRRERRDLELRVAVEQFDELLSDGARRAEDTDS